MLAVQLRGSNCMSGIYHFLVDRKDSVHSRKQIEEWTHFGRVR